MFSLLIYRILMFLLLPLIMLVLWVRSINHKEYRYRLSERLGFFPTPYHKGGIVVHAASVGEVLALAPFIEQLLQEYDKDPITITTFTPTGSQEVQKRFGDRVQHAFLPLDIFPCTTLFLSKIQPKLVIFMETELWPNLIAQCQRNRIKLLLINGRLSKKSLKSYQKITALITPALRKFDHILCQSQDNHQHFLQLGAPPECCHVSGNLKFDLNVDNKTQEKITQLQSFLPTERPIWLVASTHEGDEKIALEAFIEVKQKIPDLLLVLVPRHPERFDSVAQLCSNSNLSLAKRSENIIVSHEHIWLLDTLGELTAAFSLANVVTMGGSFNHIGGHNPLEPALFEKPIIVGPNMSNFAEIMQQLLKSQAIIQLSAASTEKISRQLSHSVTTLLSNSTIASTTGNNAYQVVMNNQGATNHTLTQVKALLNEQ